MGICEQLQRKCRKTKEMEEGRRSFYRERKLKRWKREKEIKIL